MELEGQRGARALADISVASFLYSNGTARATCGKTKETDCEKAWRGGQCDVGEFGEYCTRSRSVHVIISRFHFPIFQIKPRRTITEERICILYLTRHTQISCYRCQGARIDILFRLSLSSHSSPKSLLFWRVLQKGRSVLTRLDNRYLYTATADRSSLPLSPQLID